MKPTTIQQEILAEFGRRVLEIMESQKDWSTDTLVDIQTHAEALGVAGVDEDGYFKSNLS